MKSTAQAARSRRRPSVDTAVAMQQAQQKQSKRYGLSVAAAGGKAAQLLFRRRSASVVLPEPLAAADGKRVITSQRSSGDSGPFSDIQSPPRSAGMLTSSP